MCATRTSSRSNRALPMRIPSRILLHRLCCLSGPCCPRGCKPAAVYVYLKLNACGTGISFTNPWLISGAVCCGNIWLACVIPLPVVSVSVTCCRLTAHQGIFRRHVRGHLEIANKHVAVSAFAGRNIERLSRGLQVQDELIDLLDVAGIAACRVRKAAPDHASRRRGEGVIRH